MYNNDFLKFIRFAMNDKPMLFEEFYELTLFLQNYYTRNSRFNLPQVRLNVERNFAISQSIDVLLSPLQLCVPMTLIWTLLWIGSIRGLRTLVFRLDNILH